MEKQDTTIPRSSIRDIELLVAKYIGHVVERDKLGNVYSYSMKDTIGSYNAFKCLHSIYYEDIYINLAKWPDKAGEDTIRAYVKNVILNVIPCIEKKIVSLNAEFRKLAVDKKIEAEKSLIDWANLYDDFFAMAAYRSLKYFALYTDMDRNNEAKLWTDTLNVFSGFWYYANDMVLNHTTKFIEKQYPTGYGKSYSDSVMIAWIFGMNKNETIIKIFGAPANIQSSFEGICDIMCSKRFAKVFPTYAQFEGDRNKLFYNRNLGISGAAFRITGSDQTVNLRIVGKDSKINGVRAHYMFLDDITQFEDMANIGKHQSDIGKFNNVWFKRKSDNFNFYLIAGGTTYSRYDILSFLKITFGGENAVDDKYNKYTKVSKSDFIVEGGRSVFICVPHLDYKTDESTYPSKYPTSSARLQRVKDYEAFMAMDQQMPLPPKGNPFHFDNLMEYTSIPKMGENGRPSFCMAYLDGKRSGSDYCSMPIFSKIGDEFYLVNGIFDQRAMEDLYEKICSYLIQFNVVKLYVENNICEGLDQMLDKMLQERHFSCNIIPIYSTERKDDRIASQDANIRHNVRFPKHYELYSPSSEFGMMLDNIYTYSYVSKNMHDDGIDSVAGFSANEIDDRKVSLASICSFSR